MSNLVLLLYHETKQLSRCLSTFLCTFPLLIKLDKTAKICYDIAIVPRGRRWSIPPRPHAGVAELADAPDLGSGGYPCRFKSCRPYQKKRLACASLFFGTAMAARTCLRVARLQGKVACNLSRKSAGLGATSRRLCRRLSPAVFFRREPLFWYGDGCTNLLARSAVAGKGCLQPFAQVRRTWRNK